MIGRPGRKCNHQDERRYVVEVGRIARSWGGLALSATLACSPAAGGDTAPTRSQTEPSVVDTTPRPDPGHAWVIFGADTVRAEVARTTDEREQGLMYRQELPDGTGMLFVFDTEEVRSFWMENTYVPLDIAFLDVSLRVVDIQQMDPRTTDPHESAGPAMFALEVPQGWFAAHGVRVGDHAKVEFGP
jgi:uncharacterized membrane protein (UPF0127 family)